MQEKLPTGAFRRMVGRLRRRNDVSLAEPPPPATPDPIAPPASTGQTVAHLVSSLIQEDAHHAHDELWQNHGFAVVVTHYPVPPPPDAHFVPESDYPDPSPAFMPNLFVLGAAKSGTTTLHEYLREIPDVCMSNPKEPLFFERDWALGLEHYRRAYFRHWDGERIIGESRHRNLYLPFVAERIHRTSPEAKLIAILRNPVDRAYSHWWHTYGRGFETLDFRDAVRADLSRIERGLHLTSQPEMEAYGRVAEHHANGLYRTYVDSGYYMDQIERYLDVFDRNQLLVLLFDDLTSRPGDLLRAVEGFIGTSHYTGDVPPVHENARVDSADRGSLPDMPADVRAWLSEHYAPHNARLATFLGRDLVAWD